MHCHQRAVLACLQKSAYSTGYLTARWLNAFVVFKIQCAPEFVSLLLHGCGSFAVPANPVVGAVNDDASLNQGHDFYSHLNTNWLVPAEDAVPSLPTPYTDGRRRIKTKSTNTMHSSHKPAKTHSTHPRIHT